MDFLQAVLFFLLALTHSSSVAQTRDAKTLPHPEKSVCAEKHVKNCAVHKRHRLVAGSTEYCDNKSERAGKEWCTQYGRFEYAACRR